MKKIPTIFKRDPEKRNLVLNEINPDAQWVFDGYGVATQKWDGTCCMIRDGKLYKRYDAKKGKAAPEGFEPAQEPDPVTGHHPGWLPISDGPEDQWFREAEVLLDFNEDGTYELCGPKIQGNPERFARHVLIPHGKVIMDSCPITFDGLKEYLEDIDIEGIVWHHPDGRMAKIKKKDFGFKR